jgi:mannose-P-dolichol utilization defect 1
MRHGHPFVHDAPALNSTGVCRWHANTPGTMPSQGRTWWCHATLRRQALCRLAQPRAEMAACCFAPHAPAIPCNALRYGLLCPSGPAEKWPLRCASATTRTIVLHASGPLPRGIAKVAAKAAKTSAKVPPPAVASTVSTILGIVVLLGSFLYKVPQVVRIARRRSGEGISVAMYSVETVATSLSALYFLRRAFPLSTYGELFFIVVQNIVILGQIHFFENLNQRLAALAVACYCVGVAVLLSPAAPLKLLMALQLAAIPTLNLARVPQIALNWRRKSTGELSPITLGLQVAGNLARVFTTIVSVGDGLMLLGVGMSTVFNAALVGQYVYYNVPNRRKESADIQR